MEFISLLEGALERRAVKRFLPMQPGDVGSTHADVSELERMIGYRPSTAIEEGVARFAAWYREYYGEHSFSKGAEKVKVFRAS